MSDFTKFNLHPTILTNLASKGYLEATAIQQECIPHLLAKKDVLGIAQTGTGKTAAFCLPLIDRLISKFVETKPNRIRSLILTPTRELASQIESNISLYSKGFDLRTKSVFGGVGKQPQIDAITIGLDILVATPGRLLDLMSDEVINFDQLEVFILDEADTMLDMGFLKDVTKITELLPEDKQTLMFSASMPKQILELGASLLREPVKIEVTPESSIITTVTHKIMQLEKANKMYLLLNLLEDKSHKSVLLFCKTKFGADRIVEDLIKFGTSADSIHSNKSQTARELALSKFRSSEIRVLVATDVAARGIDVDDVSLVVNYNLPEDPRSYVHRIGRTARAGKLGLAISFCTEFELAYLKNIENLIKMKVPLDYEQPFHKEFIAVTAKKKPQKRGKKVLSKNKKKTRKRN